MPRRCIDSKAIVFRFGIGRRKICRASYLSVYSFSLIWQVTSSVLALAPTDIIYYLGGDVSATLRRTNFKSGYLEWTCRVFQGRHGTLLTMFSTRTTIRRVRRMRNLHEARELRRFFVSRTLHAIWIERLRRMEDSTPPQEVHTTRAQSNFRRSVTCFRGSTFQPDVGADGQLLARVRSALADSLLCNDDPPH